MSVSRFEYVVAEIDGDYARLKRIDEETEELLSHGRCCPRR